MRLLVLGLLLVVAACAGIETNLRCEDCFEVQVTRIIDGDTLDTSRSVIRRYGVGYTRSWSEAREATERLRDLADDTIRIEVGPRTADQYGRMLAYVYTQDGISIDEALIR